MPGNALRGILTDDTLYQILCGLLRGNSAENSVDEIIREAHMMPTIAADSINEALFDEIGDNVVTCEEDRLFLVEDYRSDIEEMLGGKSDL